MTQVTQVGNAVPPPMARAIGRTIVSAWSKSVGAAQPPAAAPAQEELPGLL